MRQLPFKRITLIVIRLSFAILVFGIITGTAAQEPSSKHDALKEEIRYIKGLRDLRLPDYADIVMERLKRTHPGAATELKVLELEGYLAKGEFGKAKAIIAGEPNQTSRKVWAMKLALADYYYAWGRYVEAQSVYESFFKKYPDGPPKALNEFYMNSAYKYAQMLMQMGQDKAALTAYKNVLKAKVEKHVKRQIMAETADLMLKLAKDAKPAERKKLFRQIEKLLEEILWGQDLWFGKAIVMKAHMKMMEGDVDEAMYLVEQSWPQLKAIDGVLRKQEQEEGHDFTKHSPLAECRYLLGVIMQEEAERLLSSGGGRDKIISLLAGKKQKGKKKKSSGAFHHFYNVFILYPASTWAPDAGIRAREVKEILETRFGADIKTTVTDEQMEKVKKLQFQEARSKFNQQRFQEAADSYVNVLNLFPEGETSVAAVSELGKCYIEIQEELYADMVIRYLAERFSQNEKLISRAGDELLKIAEWYGERQMPDRKDAVYDLYFAHFTKHPWVPAMLFRFGEQKFKIEDFDNALGYYKQIKENYPNSPLYFDAMNKIACCHFKAGDQAAEIETLKEYIGKLKKKDAPGHALVNAKFRLASAYRQLGDYNSVIRSLNAYIELTKLLSKMTDENNPYQKTPEEKKANKTILEGSIFYKAICYSMLTKPEKKLKAYKLQAIKTLNQLVESFPESQFAPDALGQIGTLLTVLGKPDEARDALHRLKAKYPGSPASKNALFLLANNLLKMGRRKEAFKIFKEMFSDTAGRYSDTQILTAGNELLKAGEYKIASEAFERVLRASKERSLREPALLGKGKALIEQENYDEGTKALSEMLKQYPKSGHTVDACLYLSRGYSELGMRESDIDERFDLFNKAMKAIKRARKFDKTPGGRAISDLRIARIFELKALADGQFGIKEDALEYRNQAIATYQILIQLGDFQDPDVRSCIEEALYECIPLLFETERWENTIEDCDKYIKMFRKGKHLVDVRKWRSKAKIKKTAAGAPPPEKEKEEVKQQE